MDKDDGQTRVRINALPQHAGKPPSHLSPSSHLPLPSLTVSSADDSTVNGRTKTLASSDPGQNNTNSSFVSMEQRWETLGMKEGGLLATWFKSKITIKFAWFYLLSSIVVMDFCMHVRMTKSIIVTGTSDRLLWSLRLCNLFMPSPNSLPPSLSLLPSPSEGVDGGGIYESDEFESDSADLSVSSVTTPEYNTQQVLLSVCVQVCLPQSVHHFVCWFFYHSLPVCQYCLPVFLLICLSPKSLSSPVQTRIQELDSTITNEYIRQLKYAQLSSIDSSQARTPSPHLLSSLHSPSKEQSAGECQHVPLTLFSTSYHLMYQPVMYNLYVC